MENAADHLKEKAKEYDKLLDSTLKDAVELIDGILLSANTLLQPMEQMLTDQDGLPRRPWYVHRVYAPGYYTGYGVKTLPGVREAIEQRDWEEAAQEINLTAEAINRYAKGIEAASGILKSE